MNLSNLTPAEGSVNRDGKRLGRGQGSGKGGTAARGHNGAKSRSGYSKKIGFEGGQMPLFRRLPKRGFSNAFGGKKTVEVSLGRLQEAVDLKSKIMKKLLKYIGALAVAGTLLTGCTKDNAAPSISSATILIDSCNSNTPFEKFVSTTSLVFFVTHLSSSNTLHVSCFKFVIPIFQFSL